MGPLKNSIMWQIFCAPPKCVHFKWVHGEGIVNGWRNRQKGKYQPKGAKRMFDTPSHSLKYSNVSLKVKTTEEWIMVHCLTCNILGVEGHVKALGCRLGWTTSRSIIHIDLHKLNNKLVSAWLEHFWWTDKPRAYMDSEDSPWPKLEGNH
jgi:hypothetical protein